MASKAKECEKGKAPKTCSPEQIRKCHGQSAVHECEGADKSNKK